MLVSVCDTALELDKPFILYYSVLQHLYTTLEKEKVKQTSTK